MGNFPGDTSNEVKILGRIEIFWECLPKFQDDIPDFQDDFYLQTVLLRLSPPVTSLITLSAKTLHILGSREPGLHYESDCIGENLPTSILAFAQPLKTVGLFICLFAFSSSNVSNQEHEWQVKVRHISFNVVKILT